jgi:hypothetical protein
VASFRTEDIDLARPMRLALREARDKSLLEMLRESGIDIVEVPGLGRKDPPASFKERGRSRFTIDLLVPASGNEIAIQAIPELRAHATALPYLRFLVAETQTGAVISTHGVAMVRVPLPERFALHKLIVSQARHGRTQKSEKDLVQAAALIAALGEIHPGALESAFLKTPTGARARIRKSLQQVRNSLQAHPASWDEIAKAAKV